MKNAVPDWMLAPGETIATIGTGMAGSSLAGLVASPLEASNIIMRNRYGDSIGRKYDTVGLIEDIQGATTYGTGYGRETTKETDAILRTVNYPLEKWSEHVAKRSGETAQDLGAYPIVAAGIETAIEFAPWILLPAAYRKGRYGSRKHQLESALADESVNAVKIALTEASPVARGVAAEVNGLKAIEDIKSIVAPIGTGSPKAQAIVKNYTNTLAAIDEGLMNGFKESTLRFSLEQQRLMFDAVAADELAIARGEPTAAVESLPLDMRNHAKGLQAVHDGIAAQAVADGVLPYSKEGWVPRNIIRELGKPFAEKIYGTKAVKTSTKHAKKRKYETVEETEAAAIEALGEDVRVSRDIRQYHLVDAELLRVIAGKKLVNEVRRLGTELGQDTVRVYDGKPTPGFFRLENPAFTEARPQLKRRPEGEAGPQGGKSKVRKDEDGDIVWERKPLEISTEFEGPLRAALEGNKNRGYQAIMRIKSAAMHAIMISPMMHGMVIWGKAFPYMPIRSLTFQNYRYGHRIENITKGDATGLAKKAKNNEWIRDQTNGAFKTTEDYRAFMMRTGHRPIGNMGWQQRMSDVMQPPSLVAGRSVVSRLIGYPAGLLGKGARTGVMRGVDWAGEFWHDKLLWDQVRASGYGMHLNIWRNLTKKGVDSELAGYVASHMANRFTGSIPFEDLSAGLRATMNAMLFSKSFTGTNLGLYTDALRGLPRAVQNQIIHNAKSVGINSKAANAEVASAARATLMTDIVGMYVLNAMTQSAIKVWQESIDLEIAGILDGPGGEKWANIDRDALMAAVYEQVSLYKDAAERYITIPDRIWSPSELSPNTTLNDPGKEHRVRMGTDPDGTAKYVRIPIGKVGEDLEKAFAEPFELLMNKLSPTVGFAIAAGLNDKSKQRGYGIEVFNEDGTTVEKLGQIAWYFLEAHTANDAIERAIDAVQGDDTAAKELVAQLMVGFSFSEGAPGGPALGAAYEKKSEQERKARRAQRRAREYVDSGEYGKAINILVDDGEMTPAAAAGWTVNRQAPQAKIGKVLKEYYITATEAERIKMDAILRNEFNMEGKK